MACKNTYTDLVHPCIMTIHTSLPIPSVHTMTSTYTHPAISPNTAMAMYTSIFILSTYTHSYAHTHLYNCTAVVTSPSHITLPVYSCSHLSIAHIMHVMTRYVACLLKPQCTTMALHTDTSLLKYSAHHHSYAQTQPEQIMALYTPS